MDTPITSEDLFRLITEHSRDLICLLDLDSQFLYTSPSFQPVLGWKGQAVLGRKCADIIHPDDRRGLRDALDEALFFREGRHVEIRFQHANGTWLAFESAVNVIFDSTGRPQRVLVAARDTNDRQRAEKEIRKL